MSHEDAKTAFKPADNWSKETIRRAVSEDRNYAAIRTSFESQIDNCDVKENPPFVVISDGFLFAVVYREDKVLSSHLTGLSAALNSRAEVQGT